METYENFKIHLHRAYPQIAKAAEYLVSEYNNAITKVDDTIPGHLEIEALFGRLHYSQNTQYPRFDNSLPEHIITPLMSMLDSFTSWDRHTDWYMVYDYYINKHERIRISYEDKKQNIQPTYKHVLSQCDFTYDDGDGNNNEWELRRYLTRVNMKFEETKEYTPNIIVKFNSVKISIRKSFTTTSKNISNVLWVFEVIQYWTGSTLQEAETRMKTDVPIWTLECEIINMPTKNILAEKDKYLMFVGLLLKMQDFLEFPICYNIIERTSITHATNTLPVFSLV